MPRVRSNVARLKRKKQVMKAARGAFGARSKLWKAAKENVERGWKYAYRDRKNKKRDFRKLWIVRINAGAHQHGMSYSVFMHGSRRRASRSTVRSSRTSLSTTRQRLPLSPKRQSSPGRRVTSPRV